jgi:hypothetical protein
MEKMRNRRKIAGIGVLTALGVFAAGAGTAIGLNALSVQVPLLPAVGQSAAETCDSDGVDTSFTYGNSSKNGVKVTGVTVGKISADCTKATVEFVSADSIVATYSGNVSSGAITLSTSIFTNEFNDVRVVLSP